MHSKGTRMCRCWPSLWNWILFLDRANLACLSWCTNRNHPKIRALLCGVCVSCWSWSTYIISGVFFSIHISCLSFSKTLGSQPKKDWWLWCSKWLLLEQLWPSFPFYLPALGRDLLGPDRPCAQLPSLTSHPITLRSFSHPIMQLLQGKHIQLVS